MKNICPCAVQSYDRKELGSIHFMVKQKQTRRLVGHHFEYSRQTHVTQF